MPARKTILLILAVLASSLTAWSQTPTTFDRLKDPLSAQPVDKVSEKIDDTLRVALPGNVHPLAIPQNDAGQVLPDQPMARMVLVLRPDASQDAALEELIRAQQDPSSPYFHQWLTPETFGEHFGISQNDLTQVTNWLEAQGMKIDEVPSSRRSIVFSGTAGQVETAFHTQMRKYSVKGQMHFANATNPEIPQALAAVVKGIVSLHDFHSVPAHETAPAYTLANGATFLMPKDWDTIYDVNPLYSQGLDGSGQSIAVVGRTDVALSDVDTFRTNAGLPAKDPQKIFVNGVNPGMPDCTDEAESALDVEWAGAIARNATIDFVSAQSGATDGVVLAAQYAVTNNVAPIVTMSYLHCESTLNDGGQSLWGSLWSQAASQGQSVFVASGDSGAAGCDLSTEQTATQGTAVNAICSTPNSTCVGGTEFNDGANSGAYWSGTNGAGMSSALSYIPELTWNESSWAGAIVASGGGISTVYPRPGWQSAPGVPAGTMRLVPDVAASSAIHDAYVIQIQGGPFYIAGTSAATPSLASVMALVLQNAGSRQGNANPALYTLASQQAAGGPAVFHDITGGNNSVPGVTGYSAGPGYDMTTGLGSVDAFLLVNSWSNSRASNFSLSSLSSNLTVAPGNTTTATVTMSAQGGFSSPVTLSAAGAPAGVTVTFSSPTLNTSSPVTMTVSATSNAAGGTFPITVTGSGGGFNRTIEFTVTVSAVSFTMLPNPTGASVNVGNSTTFIVTVTALNGFNSAVALSVNGLPAGVTAGFSPSSIASGNGTSTLTVSAASGAAVGTSVLAITGTSGNLIQTQTITLAVANPTLTLNTNTTNASVAAGASTPMSVTTAGGNGFSSAVALSVSGLPSGVTGTFAPTSIASPGSGSSTLTLAAASSASTGSSTLTITATGGGVTKTQTVNLTVSPAPSFALSANSSSASVAAGSSTPITITTAGSNGFSSAVALSISGLPSGVTGNFAPTTIASPGSGSSTLTLAAASSASTGNSTLTITAVGGGLTKTQTVTLTVSPAPSLTLSASASSASFAAGSSTPITITTAGGNGFSSAVALSVSGLPSGVTGTFAPTNIASPGSGSSTLTLAATTSASMGNSTLTITAAGGGITKTQTVTLTISPAPSFTLSANSSSASVVAGSSTPITITTAGGNGFSSVVALSVSGLPSGVTGTFAPTSIASPGSGSSTLTLAAALSASTGKPTLTITAVGGGVTKTQTVTLTVSPAPSLSLSTNSSSASVAVGSSTPITITTAASNGFSSAVALSISGLPSGVTGTFAPTSIASPGSGSSTLTLAAASAASTGNSTLTITAAGGGITKTMTLNLAVSPAPTFTLSSSATSGSIASGASTPVTVTTAVANGFSSAVALSVSGLPAGVTASFAPTSIASPGSGKSTLTLTASASAPAGNSSLTITAAGGGVTKTQTFSLTVTGTFALSISASSAGVARSGSVPITVTTAGGTGFNSAVALSASGLPSGVTASFAPTSIATPGSGHSTLTFSAGTNAVVGVSTVTITATGGGTSKTQTISLTVLTPSFTLTPAATSISVARGASGHITFTTALVNGFNASVAFSVSGLSSGVTASFAPTSISAPGGGTTTLTLSASSSATLAGASLTVTATGGGLTKTQAISLTVASTATSTH